MWIYIGTTIIALVVVWYFFFRNDDEVKKPKRILDPSKPVIIKTKKKAKQEEEEEVQGPKLSVFYYSQTGTAEDFSKRLVDDGKLYGFHAKCYDVEEYDTERFEGSKHNLIVFCAATYGEGDPPTNAEEFHNWLMEDDKSDTLLKGTYFAVFGLGDRTYDNFCKMGKVLDKRLESLGSTRLHPRGEGDSYGNIEEDFLKWKKSFWNAVVKQFGVQKKEGKVERKARVVTYDPNDEKLKGIDVNNISRWRVPAPTETKRRRTYDTKNPYLATIAINRELHTPKSDRSCRHIEIEVGDELNYEAGDHVGVYPENDITIVNELAERLGADLDQIFELYMLEDPKRPVVGPATIRAALLQFYDLLLPPRKPMLRMLADYTNDETEKQKLLQLASDDPDEQEYFNSYILNDSRTILEVLRDFPGVKPPVDHFLELLPRLQPRFYSISSSPNVHKGTVHVTAVLVQFTTPTGRVHNGVCTTWLSKQIPSADKKPLVPIFIRKSNFHLPPQLKTPVIMVGPGTGLAPFRGFLYERKYRRDHANDPPKILDNILFFGCRHPDIDYIYKDELEKLVEDNVTKLHVAFSRQQAQKVYVQHRLMEPEVAKDVWQKLEAGGYFYICGDGKRMSKDVTAALKTVIRQEGGMDEQQAEKYLQNLSDKGRICTDVW